MKSIFVLACGVVLGAYLFFHILSWQSSAEKVKSLDTAAQYETQAIATAKVVQKKGEKIVKALSEDDGAPSKK